MQCLVGVDDLDDPRLAGITRDARYRVVLELAVDNLAAGMPVVLVAPFTAERAEPAAWAATHDRLVAAAVPPCSCGYASSPEMLRRLRERGSDRDAAKLADEAGYLSGAAVTACRRPSCPSRARRLPAPR